MLTDPGPLIALIDIRDPHHATCMGIMRSFPSELMETTWPCFTEAIFLLGGVGSHRYQAALWTMRSAGRLVLLDLTAEEADRTDALMAQYQNVPMDLADASLVAVAESRGIRRLFTLDSDFYIYRLADGSILEPIR